MNQKTNIDETLAERGARYGDFTDHAKVAQTLQDVMRSAGDTTGWQALNSVQKEALTVIADKIARILTGDPNYADNWHDIQGYAKLVKDRLPNVGMLKANSDDWIQWNGGECPVHPNTRVKCWFRFGDTAEIRARVWPWAHYGYGSDIIAYCIIKDAKS